jgi:hypothetical protein
MEEITLDTLDLKASSDFGGGLEFLMNDKKKPDNLNFSIEDELKELEMMTPSEPSIKEIKPLRMNFENTQEPIKIGRDTISIDTMNQTSNDGFRHINDIHIENEIKNIETKTKEEILKEKFTTLRNLQELEEKGATLTKHYTMDSSLDEMKGEYEHLISERERKNSIQFQGKMLTTFITGVEFLNSKLNPFDINLNGFSESVSENLNDYDDIFSELHEKYRGKGKMAPEIRLLFQLVSSGVMVHMANTLFKSAMPGMDDILRQNPDIMNQFAKATVQSMEKNTPGMSGFLNEFSSRPTRVQPPPPYKPREEMSGPGNINNVISGLGLNKKINLDDRNESIISVEDMDNIGNNVGAVSKRGRRNRSDKTRPESRVEVII